MQPAIAKFPVFSSCEGKLGVKPPKFLIKSAGRREVIGAEKGSLSSGLVVIAIEIIDQQLTSGGMCGINQNVIVCV